MNYSTIEIVGNVFLSHNIAIEGNIKIATGGALYPAYTGEYIVTPRVYEQYLDTDNKVMSDDVTILEIPKSEVENIYNGLTVTIG